MLPLLDFLPHAPPRIELGRFPSPVESYPEVGRRLGFESLVVKRDDLNAADIGGNKLRALEWILPAASGDILSLGGYGSSWCATLARYGRASGRQVRVVLFPQPWNDTVHAIMARTVAHAEVELLRSVVTAPWGIARAWWQMRVVDGGVSLLPPGGASVPGMLGSVNAALELVKQVERGEAIRPDVVVAPLGSGGTVAGLLAGFDLAGWEVTVCGVAVTSRWFTGRATVHRLLARLNAGLRAWGSPATRRTARLQVVWGELGRGYGHLTRAAAQAREMLGASTGIELELTYGAKAFAAVRGLADSFRHPCFWHTFDHRLVLAGPAVAPDHPLLQQARARAESLWPITIST